MAQEPFIKNFSFEDGRLSPFSYQVLQDYNGYLWTCTNSGVIKYDGTNFHTYNLKNGFPDYGAFHMLLDKQKRIWFVTFSGKLCYYKNKRFKTIILGQDSSQAKWVCETPTGDIYVSTFTGNIYKVDTNDQVSHIIKLKYCIFILEWLRDSTLLLTNGTEYIELNLVSRKLKKSPVQANTSDYPRMGILKEGLALSCKDGIRLYNGINSRLIIPTSSLIEPMSYFDDDEYIWVAHRNGLSKFKKTSKLFIESKAYHKNKHTTSIIRDNSGKIWFTTFYNGLNMIVDENVKLYTPNASNPQKNIFLSIMKGDSYVSLINLLGEIYEIKNNTMKEVSIIKRNNKKEILNLTYSQINSEEHLFHLEGTVVTYNPKTRRVTRPYKSIDSVSTIISQYSNGNRSFLIRCPFGVIVPKYIFTEVSLPDFRVIEEKHIIVDSFERFKSYAVDNEHKIWLGYKDGLWLIKDHVLEKFSDDKKEINTYTSHISFDNSNRMWVCTMGDGLYCIDPIKLKVLVHLNESNGLANNICNKVIHDTKNNIWVATPSGLIRIKSPLTNRLTHLFSTDNILPSNYVLDIANLNNVLYVSTNKGIIECPIEIKNIEVNYPTYITKTMVDGNEINDSAISCKYYSNIDINFITIAYGKGEPITYEYRLNSSEQRSWEVTTATSVKYEQLQPGEYEFQVRAAPSSLSDALQVASIKIIVQPLYWQTWWFKALVIASFVLAFTLSTVAYFTIKNKETLSNKKLIESQLNSLRAQINPHFIFNSLNSIQDFILDQQPRMANLYLSRFASLMRMIVENSKKEFTTIGEEIDFLEMYLSLEKLRLNDDLDIYFDVDSRIDKINALIPTMLLQPLVENAVKHGLSPLPQNRTLTIRFSLTDTQQLQCSIEDNGVGRYSTKTRPVESNLKTSVGLQNIRERLDLLFADSYQFSISDLANDSGNPLGTKVEIVIPVS